MDDFPGLLTRDFGLKPQGKAAPMAPPRSSSVASSYGVGSNSYFSSKSGPIFDDHDRSGGDDIFGDVFRYSEQQPGTRRAESGTPATSSSSFDYDSVFKDRNSKSSLPVFDTPVYDEDIFDGLPGMKSASSTTPPSGTSIPVFDGDFTSSPKLRSAQGSSSVFDDLLGDFQKKESVEQPKNTTEKNSIPLFDDLIPGFGRSGSTKNSRSNSEASQPQKPSSDSGKTSAAVSDDPFQGSNSTYDNPVSSSGFFVDPLEEVGKFNSSEDVKNEKSFATNGIFDDLDSLGNITRSVPQNPTVINTRGKDKSPLYTGSTDESNKKASEMHSSESAVGQSNRKVKVEEFSEATEADSDMNASSSFHRSERDATSPTHLNGGVEKNVSRSESTSGSFDDIWLSVSEIPLYTQPTTAPPPSRPPPRPPQISRSGIGSPKSRRKVSDFPSFSNSSMASHVTATAFAERNPASSQLDELEDFVMGKGRNNVGERGDSFTESADSSEAAASAAAMKEAMGRAEATFRQMREREIPKSVRTKDPVQADSDVQDAREKELMQRMEYEKQQRDKEEREREKRRQELDREREEREREQLRLERAREAERERERARQAVERATREARERAAADARMKAEKTAVEKANNEARQRATRAAVQKVQAEARERAAAEARERVEKAAAEAREKAEMEARERETAQRTAAMKAEAEAKYRSERAAVERVAAEARQRAAAAAAAAAAASASARVNHQKNENLQKDENDLESFFSSRASSAPRPRAATSDPFFDTQNKGWPEGNSKPFGASSSNMRKASSTTNIVDDLSSIFGGGSSTGEFQEVEGESEERRKARMERHQRTQERAQKALAEKNQRDLQAQREQAERDRHSGTLDAEIKRWAAGKEGNLRALLSTLQYVLWPECGWQPVSLTDLITAASVKKVYRKATLCIHPDKVQQKGASLQQKYIAEKVFDLLKEAWNKFNSEELF